MCGIAGIFYRRGRPVEQARLKAMTDTLHHRGPDGEGFWREDNIGFGHRRLAIREMSDMGRQPMPSPDSQVVTVFNGEIYNDLTLKAELRREFGCRFSSTSDTEVIPQGYQAWGLDLFNRLEGIFAIALWDRQTKTLILARDGIGTKPLYYHADRETVRFASEIKALLADNEQQRHISATDLSEFLLNGYAAPDRSLIDGIYQVPPGHILVFGSEGDSRQCFWQPTRKPDLTDLNAAVAEFEPLFEKILLEQLVSDVPLGVLQSGGIDSSLISYTLKDKMKVPLYCASFQEKSHDESAEANLVAAATGHPLQIISTHETNAEETFRSVVHYSDGQLADSSAIPTYLVNEAIGRVARVALSGDGADEFFGGYQTYYATGLAHKVAPFLPASIWEHVGSGLRFFSSAGEQRIPKIEKLARLILGMAAPVPHASWRRYLMPRERKILFTRIMAQENDTDQYAQSFREANGSLFDRALLADQRYYLPGDLLMKADRMSMAHSVEVRVPFLDRRIMDFAGRLDRELMISGPRHTKILLREALRRKGANSLITDRPKTGFNYPLNQILRTHLKPLATTLFTKDTDIFSPYLDPEGVTRLWREHQDGRINHNYLLWTLLTFGVWRQTL